MMKMVIKYKVFFISLLNILSLINIFHNFAWFIYQKYLKKEEADEGFAVSIVIEKMSAKLLSVLCNIMQ